VQLWYFHSGGETLAHIESPLNERAFAFPFVVLFFFFCSYDLHLITDLEHFTFAGVCEITLRINRSQLTDTNRNQITLHAKELCFIKAEYKFGDQIVVADEIVCNLKATTVTFIFGKELPADDNAVIHLKIDYTGFHNDQMAGRCRTVKSYRF
jgi:hypothetical protein